jgi:hypothetical protein
MRSSFLLTTSSEYSPQPQISHNRLENPALRFPRHNRANNLTITPQKLLTLVLTEPDQGLSESVHCSEAIEDLIRQREIADLPPTSTNVPRLRHTVTTRTTPYSS